MDVVSTGPLPVASVLWQARPATWVLTVVCKATFTLAPVEMPLAPHQEPIDADDEHWDDDAARSLRVAGDLAPFKQSAEVLLTGHAFAPGGEPVRALIARMVIGEVDKSIQIHADRAFNQQGELQEGPRFTRMPLVYERAAGGPDTWNPAGVRRDGRDRYGRAVIPNLMMPDKVVTSPDDFIDPVGFGPIAPSWPSRRDKLGRYASSWSRRALAEGPLPDEIDRAFFNVAPPDQRLAELRDNERIVLSNLHPDHAHLVTSLPGVRPRAVVTGRAGGPQEIAMRFDTLAIDTNRLLVTAVWRGQIPLAHAQEAGRVIVAAEQIGQPLSVEEIARTSPTGAPGRGLDGATIRVEESPDEVRPLLPFVPAPRPGASPAPAGAPRPPPLPPRAPKAPPAVAPKASAISESTVDLVDPGAGADAPPGPAAVTPFRAAAQGPVQPFQPAPPQPFQQAPVQPFQQPAPPQPFQQAPVQPFQPAPPPWPAAPPRVREERAVPAPPPLVLPVGPASPQPVSPWAGAVPSAGASPAGTIAQVTADAPPAEVPQTIGAVLAASNAAAAALSAGAPAGAHAEAIAPISSPAAAPAAKRDVLALVWLDRRLVPRIVRKPAWRRLLDALDDEPIDPEVDDPVLSDEPSEVEDRNHVFEILDRAAAIDVEGVHESLARAAGKRGKLTPPLELVEGELTLPFDEVETLKAMVSTVTPLAAGDEALGQALATAEKFLSTPGVASAPAVAEGLTTRIREAFAQGKQRIPADSLDAQVERALLEQRHYQKRKVLGGPHLRGLLQVAGSEAPLVVYLPVAVAEELPLSARFRARIIAAVHLAVDPRESEPAALAAAALGRVVELGRSRTAQ